MTPATARGLVRRVGPDPDPPADAELVSRFARSADPAAFAALVRRHGPMVLAACRRMLPESADADDAFQATFLVLLRKAGAVRPPGAVGGWLHGVAVRTAQKARVAAARRRRREMTSVAGVSPSPAAYAPGSPEHAELRAVIDEELAKLPEPLRAAVVLCDLGGKTRAEAAADLGCPEGTVAARLHRARKALADQLARRGVTAPAALAVASAAVPADLFAAVAGFAQNGPVPSAVRALADGVVRGLAAHPLSLAFTAVAAAVLAAGAGVLWAAGQPTPDGAAPGPDAPPAEVKVGPVYSVGYSADGSKLVHVGGGKAVVRDAATKAERYAVDAEFAQFSGDGTKLFVLEQAEFRTLDAATGKVLATAPRNGPPPRMPGRNAAFAADGTRRAEHDGWSVHLAGGGPELEGQAPVNLGAMLLLNHGHNVAFSPDGARLAGVHQRSADFTRSVPVAVWDAATGKRLGAVGGEPNYPVHSFAWSPSGAELAVGVNGGIHVHAADTLTEVRRVAVPRGVSLTALAWSPDGRTLAAGQLVWDTKGDTGRDDDLIAQRVAVVLYDAASGKELRRVAGFADNLPVAALAFRPDGRELACAAGFLPGDGPAGNLPPPAPGATGLRVIALDPPAAPRGGGRVSDLSVAPDGKTYLVVAGGKAAVKDFATDKVVWEADAVAARFTADGKTVMTMGPMAAERRDAATGKALQEHPRAKLDAKWNHVAFNRDGFPYAAHFDYEARLFAAGGEEPVKLAERHAPLSDRVVLRPTGKAVTFSLDGRFVAAVGVMLTTTENAAAVWDVRTGKRLHVYPSPARSGEWRPATAVAFSADSKQLAVAVGKVVQLFDTDRFAAGARLGDTPGSGPVTALAFAPDGKSLAVGYRLPLPNGADKEPKVVGHKTEVQLVELTTGKELKRFDGFEGVNHLGPTVLPVTALAFSPDGQTLLAGTGASPVEDLPADAVARGEVKRFNLAAQPPAPPAGAAVTDVSFSPDGRRYLVVAGGKAAVRDFATDRTIWEADAEAARFAAGGAVVTLGATVARRDADTGTALKEHPRAKADFAWHLAALSPDGTRYAGHAGHAARLHDTATAAPVRLRPEFGLPGYLVGRDTGSALVFSPDGKRVAAVGVLVAASERGVAAWDTATGERMFAPQPAPLTWPVVAAAYSPDGKTLALATKHDVYLWTEGAKEPRREAMLGDLGAVGFLPDGRLVVAGEGRYAAGGNKVGEETVYHRRLFVHVVDPKQAYGGLAAIDFAAPPRPEGAPPVTALAVSPDGKTFLVGTAAGAVTRLTLAAQPPPAGKAAVPVWREAARLPDFDDRVHSVAFSPDGKALAVGGRGGAAQHTLTLWDAATRKKLWAGGPLPAGTTGVAFSPSGPLLAATRDKTTGLYDAATGQPVLMNPPLPGGKAVAFGLPGPGVAGRPWHKLAVTDGYKVTVVTWVEGAAPKTVAFGPLGNAAKVDDPRPAGVAFSPAGGQLVFIPNAVTDTPAGKQWYAQVWGGGGAAGSAVLRHGPAPVSAVAWSPDGKHIATGCQKGDVVVWDAATFEELGRTRLGGRTNEGVVHALALSPDGKTLAAAVDLLDAKNAQRVVLLDATTGERRQDLQGFGSLTPVALAFTPDGRTLAVGLADFLPQVQPPPGGKDRPLGAVALFTTDPEPRAAPPQPPEPRPGPAWREAANLPTDDGPVHSVAFRPDGKEIAAGGERARVVAWAVPGFKERQRWALDPDRADDPTAVAYSTDGRALAAARGGATVMLDAATGRPFPAPAPLPPGGRAVAFSPPFGPQSGPVRHRFAVTDGKTVHVVTWPEGLAPVTKSFGPIPGAAKVEGVPPAAVAWAPDGRRLVFVPNAKADAARADLWVAQVWDAGSGAGSAVLPHGTAPVTAVAWSPDGKHVATGCRLGDVVVWDAKTFGTLRRVRVGGRMNQSEVHALAFAPDGQSLAAAVTLDEGRNVERVVVLDPATGARIGNDIPMFRDGGELTPRALAFSPDGKSLVVGLDGRDPDANARVGAVRVYTTEPEPDGQAAGPARPAAWRPRPVTTERAAVAAVAFAPDEKTFAVAGADGVVEVWDAAALKGRETSTRVKAPGPGALAFVPTTSFYATADAGGLSLHDPSGIKLSHRAWAHPTRVVAFAPDGKRVVLRDGSLVRVLPFPIDPAAPGGARAGEDTDEVPPVAWSPDGKRLVAVTRLPSSGFWALTEPTALAAPHVLGHSPDKIGGVAWSGDGKWLVTGGHDGKVIVTDGATLKETRRWSVAGPGERVRVRSVVVTPDGATVLAGVEVRAEQQARPVAPVNVVLGWELATGREVVRLALPPGGPVDALALSPDGRLMVAGRSPVAAGDPVPQPGPALVVWERP